MHRTSNDDYEACGDCGKFSNNTSSRSCGDSGEGHLLEAMVVPLVVVVLVVVVVAVVGVIMVGGIVVAGDNGGGLRVP